MYNINITSKNLIKYTLLILGITGLVITIVLLAFIFGDVPEGSEGIVSVINAFIPILILLAMMGAVLGALTRFKL